MVREWLPNVEAELKFRPLPDDEESILQLMENHEVLNIFTTIVYIFLSAFLVVAPQSLFICGD